MSQYSDPISNDSLQYDIAIAGGGIVGATLAAALKNSGLKIVLIEAQLPEQSIIKPQAYALSVLSSRILKGIGVWEKIFPHIGRFENIKLSDGNYPNLVPFETQDLGTEYLGYVGEHRVILSALQEFLTSCPQVEWVRPAKVVAVEYGTNQAKIRVKQGDQDCHLTAKLVVGADGAKSQIRSLAGIKTRGWKYWQSCVAFTIQHQAAVNNIAFERFCETGPMGVLPLPGNRCQIVWTAPHAQAKELAEMAESAFITQLEQRLNGVLGSVNLVSPRLLFPVQLMQSDRYVQPRLALVGDAAHCCHPVGGQGLNLGIRDAAALAQVLHEAVQKKEDIGQLSVLKCYETWRKTENLLILGFTDFLDRLFSNDWLPLVVVRRLGIEMMRHIHPIKVLALQLMTGLLGRHPRLSQ
ncbi:MAG: FAD-dependent hydroxylase [Snowella sp.]|nr:FAD-dependent hydroxylase [Snowella sp.]